MSTTITAGLTKEFRSGVESVPVRRPPGPRTSEEELQRRENDTAGEWYTAAEVEAELRELWPSR